ncbi:MAG: hypothetical protein ACI9FY_000382, partial [Patiriisocius sp.]
AIYNAFKVQKQEIQAVRINSLGFNVETVSKG